jgi:hypothetical protein
MKKCHGFEIDHGRNAARHQRKSRSTKIDMSRRVRPYIFFFFFFFFFVVVALP